MSVSRSIEIERKYAVPDGAPLPDLAAVPGVTRADAHAPVRLEATYVDTEDRTLLTAGIAVRRRTGGHDAGWHVKLPGPVGRIELHAPLDEAAPDRVPADFAAALGSRVRDRPLVPIAVIRTERRAVLVEDVEGGAVEVVDDRVTATDVRGGVLRAWREWEAEQAEDSEACAGLLARVDAALTAAGATRSDSPAKIAQALGLVGARPTAAEPGTAGDVVAVRMAEHAEQLHRGVLSLVLDGDEGGSTVHAMRKTIRRARSLLAMEAVAGPAGEALRERLGALGRRLGEVRDPLVAAATARDLLAPEEGLPGFEDATALLVTGPLADQPALTRRLTEDLGSPRARGTMAAMEAFVPDGPAAVRSARTLSRLAERTVRRARRRARRGVRGDLETMHRARKAAKRARFVVEELVAAGIDVPKKVVKQARRDEQAQDVLGDHRDLALLLESLPAASVRLAAGGGNAYALGRASGSGERRLALLHRAAVHAVRRLG